jgi:hypothetical protein
LEFNERKNLEITLSEVNELVETVLTPVFTTESEGFFSTLKRVKTYLRNSMGQGHLHVLAVLSIHKDVIADTPRFNQKVQSCLHFRKIEKDNFFINKATFN